MSNSLAVAMVTATIARLLRNAIQPVFGTSVEVSTERPRRNGEDAPAGGITGSQAAANLFLYEVNPNPSWRNNDLPTRSSSGQLLQRPVAAVDLHYVLTFYGDESLLEPQRLLGIAVETLHSTPVLSREMIAATKLSVAGGDLAFLAAADLEEQVDLVRITPHCFDLDHMAKLWSIFSQNAYALSVAYLASVVLIESGQTPQAGLPVREGQVYVTVFKHPYIDSARSESGGPITVGSRVTLTGRNLKADLVRVRIGAVEIDPLGVSDTQISVAIPYFGVRAGVQGISVTHPLMLGDPPTERPGTDSNAAAITLSPVIADTDFDTTTHILTVRVYPAVGRRQKARLLLVRSNPLATYQIEAAVSGDPNTAQETLDFDLSGVAVGTYLVRVQIDGAQSPLESDNSGNFIGPTVNVS